MDSIEDCHEEIMLLRDALLGLQQERDTLKSRLDNALALMKQMESELLLMTAAQNEEEQEQEQQKDKKEKSLLSKDVLDRWQFYFEHKRDPAIYDALLEKFKSIGIDNVPWQLVKKNTDKLYLSRLLQ